MAAPRVVAVPERPPAAVLLVGAAGALAAHLAGPGLTLETPATAAEARAWLRVRTAALVVVAIAGDGDPLALSTQLRDDDPAGAVPVVLVASHAQWDALAARALAAGVADYLATPIDGELVRRKVAVHVERFHAVTALRRAPTPPQLRQFAYAAAHDAGAPLRTIARHAARLRAPAGEELDRAAAAAAIEGSVGRLQTLVSAILDHAEAHAALRLAPVALDDVLREVRHDLAAPAMQAGAQVEVGPLPTLRGDRGQLARLFRHLLANALTYRHPDRAPSVVVRATVDETGAVVEVCDDGAGFEAHLHDELFQPFRRLVARHLGGAGLGLTSALHIARGHGGTIEARGAPGAGATFRVRLPLTPAERHAYLTRVAAAGASPAPELAT